MIGDAYIRRFPVPHFADPAGRRRAMAYWATTGLIATECLVGGVWGILRLPPFAAIVTHLGYPTYVGTILGTWYALGGVALLAPRFARLKEWAYAGLIFNYTGAVASHLAVGSGAGMLVAPIAFAGLTMASWVLRPPARRDTAPGSAAGSRGRTIAYWVTTGLIAVEFALGGVWDLLRIPFVRGITDQLGYPAYLLVILGVWKVPGAVALLVPRFPRLKEWAYAGMIFNMTGAVASHLAAGTGTGQLVYPIIVIGLTAASWLLRPSARRDLAPS